MDVPIERRTSQRRYAPWALGALALLLLGAVTLGLGRVRQAAPVVQKASLYLGTVKRGELLREVSGPGRLTPDAVRVVSAVAAGTVQSIHVEPGAAVEPDTLLLSLDNPELELRALEVASEVKGAEAELLELKATLAIEDIEQRVKLQNVQVQHREAQRKAAANELLAERDVVAPLVLAETRERAEELTQRLQLEREHVQVLQEATRVRIAAQKAQVERLKAQQELRELQVAGLHVRAGAAGVVQELPLEVGEQVEVGARLAKVVDPSRLRAELRIPETRAHGIAVGQPARVSFQGETVQGRVSHVDPGVQGGNVTVDVAFAGELPEGAKLDLSVDGRIELDRLTDVLHLERPAGSSRGSASLWKLTPDGKGARRVSVELGDSSVSAVQVVSGLSEGDRVILSDMAQWKDVDVIELQ